jgi:SPP1 family predicted phage head-tail adaptor
MQAGKLRHRITILQNMNDGTTDPSPSDWQPLFTFTRNGKIEHDIPAAQKGLTGRLFYQAAAAQSENDVIFTIRYHIGIKPTMRIVLDGDKTSPYEILIEPVDTTEHRQWLEIHARRISLNGS